MSTKSKIKEIMSKRYIKIIILILFISLISLVGTYAWFTWSSTSNTSVTLSINNLADVTFASGNDINVTNIAPVYNYTDGVSTTFVIKNNSTSNNVSYNIILEVTNISNDLKDESFKYTLLKDNIVVGEGNLKDAINGKSLVLNTGSITKSTTSNYKLYFWIDGNIKNSSNMMNKSLVGKINIEEKLTYVNTLFNSSTKTNVVNNNITYKYDTSHNLMEDIAGNIRYYGASPNNYIYFNCDSYPSTNCELWRIIGVFDGKIKLIRNETIGNMAYDNDYEDTYLKSLASSGSNPVVKALKYDNDNNDNEVIAGLLATEPGGGDAEGQNDYSSSSLQKILNNYYYNKLKYTGYSTYDFTNNGIKNDATRNMIAETIYYLGGLSTTPMVYSNAMYNYERDTGVYSGNSTTWVGKIALPYPSDYGYATDLNKCLQTLYNYDSNTNSYACRTNDWMFSIINSGSKMGWLLTSSSTSVDNALRVGTSGAVVGNDVWNSLGVTPVLYLNSNQNIVGGDGSQSNPYQLSVN